MFREMRRKKQALSLEENIEVLQRGTAGVLAVSGDGDYPYAVPLSYMYEDGKIFFHCAKEGHKLDSIARNDKVSFCVIDQNEIRPEEYTTYFRSVIAFGRARILEDEAEKRSALEKLAAKYSPQQEQGRLTEIEKKFNLTLLVEINIEHMTGKESLKLMMKKQEQNG